jgi:WD40 repeat protein
MKVATCGSLHAISESVVRGYWNGEIFIGPLRGPGGIFFPYFTHRINCVDMANDGRRFMIGTEDGQSMVGQTQLQGGISLIGQMMMTKTAPVLSVAVSNVDIAVTGAADNAVRVFDASNGLLRKQLPHAHPVHALAVTPLGTLIASGDGPQIQLWDAVTGNLLQTAHLKDGIESLVFSPGGKFLASVAGKYAATIDIWDVSNPTHGGRLAKETSCELRGPVVAMSFSRSSDRLGLATASGSTYHWLFHSDVAPLMHAEQVTTGKRIHGLSYDFQDVVVIMYDH